MNVNKVADLYFSFDSRGIMFIYGARENTCLCCDVSVATTIHETMILLKNTHLFFSVCALTSAFAHQKVSSTHTSRITNFLLSLRSESEKYVCDIFRNVFVCSYGELQWFFPFSLSAFIAHIRFVFEKQHTQAIHDIART